METLHVVFAKEAYRFGCKYALDPDEDTGTCAGWSLSAHFDIRPPNKSYVAQDPARARQRCADDLASDAKDVGENAKFGCTTSADGSLSMSAAVLKNMLSMRAVVLQYCRQSIPSDPSRIVDATGFDRAIYPTND